MTPPTRSRGRAGAASEVHGARVCPRWSGASSTASTYPRVGKEDDRISRSSCWPRLRTDQLPDNVRPSWGGSETPLRSWPRPRSTSGQQRMTGSRTWCSRPRERAARLWTYPFPGARYDRRGGFRCRRLDGLYRLHAEGRSLSTTRAARRYSKMFEPDAVRNDILERLRAVTEQRWRRPPGRWQRWASDAALKGLRVLFRADRAWNS